MADQLVMQDDIHPEPDTLEERADREARHAHRVQCWARTPLRQMANDPWSGRVPE